jgi:type II secretory pathway predicted ATPase ExeA
MNNEDKIRALFGLKHNPFARNLPPEALWTPPGAEAFFFRVENIVLDGGFALITGEPGLGKSKALQLLSERLLRIGGDLVVGVMEYPPSTVSDFYRELGDLFGVNLAPANRYGSFKTLRERWREHIQTTLFRPVLLVDEAQEMVDRCLTELRLLSSAKFDSEVLLTVVLCGDGRLSDRFRSEDLAPLGSRIRTRWILEPLDHKLMRAFLDHALDHAGTPHLMTPGLKDCLVEHCAGNPRILCGMAEELLHAAAQRQLKRLDEKLYLEFYDREVPPQRQRRPRRGGRH